MDHAWKRRCDVLLLRGARSIEERDDYDCREHGLWPNVRTVRRLWDRPESPSRTAARCANWGRPEPIKRIRLSENITRA